MKTLLSVLLFSITALDAYGNYTVSDDFQVLKKAMLETSSFQTREEKILNMAGSLKFKDISRDVILKDCNELLKIKVNAETSLIDKENIKICKQLLTFNEENFYE